MAKERLVGSDGKLVVVTLGTELTGDAAQDLDDLTTPTAVGAGAGWYQITAKGATSTFDTDLAVGDLFYDRGLFVLGTNDKVKKLTETEKADVTSFSLDISRAEIDVTTLSDDVRRYRVGKVDMTGSLEGITILGTTDAAGWVINNFMPVTAQTDSNTVASPAVTKSDADDSDIYIKGVLQKDTAVDEKEAFFWAKINLLGAKLGASGEDAQSFSSNFRIAPGDPEPTYYVRTVTAAAT